MTHFPVHQRLSAANYLGAKSYFSINFIFFFFFFFFRQLDLCFPYTYVSFLVLVYYFLVPSSLSTTIGELNHYSASFHQSLFVPNCSGGAELNADPMFLWIIRLAFSSTDGDVQVALPPFGNLELPASDIAGMLLTKSGSLSSPCYSFPLPTQSSHQVLTVASAQGSHLSMVPVEQIQRQIVRRQPDVSIVGVSQLNLEGPSSNHPNRFTALKGKNVSDLLKVSIFPLMALVS